MKRGSERWFKVARGAGGVYAAAVPGLLLLMATEPTPVLLGNMALILAILGLLVFLLTFTRLHFLRAAAPVTDRSKASYRARTRMGLAMFGWFNLGAFVLCGLVWIFAAKAQCLIQGWIFGRVAAAGCMG